MQRHLVYKNATKSSLDRCKLKALDGSHNCWATSRPAGMGLKQEHKQQGWAWVAVYKSKHKNIPKTFSSLPNVLQNGIAGSVGYLWKSCPFPHLTNVGECVTLCCCPLFAQGRSWIVKRSYEDFRVLDKHLHLCIYDRRFSQLSELPRSDALKDSPEVSYQLCRYLKSPARGWQIFMSKDTVVLMRPELDLEINWSNMTSVCFLHCDFRGLKGNGLQVHRNNCASK